MSSPPARSLSMMLIIFIILIHLHQSSYAQTSNYETCKEETINCGNLGTLAYPFYGDNRPQYCGYPGFEISCQGQLSITIMSQTYYVTGINSTIHTLTVAREDYYTESCPASLDNIAINFTLFGYTPIDQNITFYYNCESDFNVGVEMTCKNSTGSNIDGYFLTQSMLSSLANGQTGCSASVFVPVEGSAIGSFDKTSLDTAFKQGFELKWSAADEACNKCINQLQGECGFNSTNNKFACYCPDGSDCTGQLSSKDSSWVSGITKPTLIAAALSVAGIKVVVVLVLNWKGKGSLLPNSWETSYTGKRESANVEAFLRYHGSLAPRRYTYKEIKRMANDFRDKLGEGGYGGVYKGKLEDHRLVAVKLLKKSKGNGEEFINEVAAISRTNHVNIVSLLGFCSEGGKRALVYEFMPNGSLEKFLHEDRSQSISAETLFNISTGIARGLEYLHQGCNTIILHFDIKPHNILLDRDFQPKISDFGLSKSCLQRKSIISMSGAREFLRQTFTAMG